MSKIGKQVLTIPAKTEVSVSDGFVHVKGPLGTLERKVLNDIEIVVKDNTVLFERKKTTRLARALWGTYASHVSNMLDGVSKAFEKKLVVEGVGYKAEVSGKHVVLTVGFSHPVKLLIPEGIQVTAEKNILTLKGIDKDLVGEFTARIRAIKKPEPYKGKGIRYEGEFIKRKQGKKAM